MAEFRAVEKGLLSGRRSFFLVMSLGFGRGSRVEGTKSRVEGNMSRVLKNENKIIKIKKNKKIKQ